MRRAGDHQRRWRVVRASGDPRETGTLLVCLNERFARPGAYEVEFGTLVREIVERLGGGLRDSASLRALQVGGPLGGFLGPDALDLPLLESALSRAGGALGHGSLVAIDDRVRFPDLLRHFWEFAAPRELRDVHAVP